MTITETSELRGDATTLTALIERAGTTTSALTPAQFAAEADDPRTVVVDVREADERVADGSIVHAVHIPRGLLEFRADPASAAHDPRLRPDGRVLLYCGDGCRSALSAASLQTLGYRDVAHLDGGLLAWQAAWLPVVGRLAAPY